MPTQVQIHANLHVFGSQTHENGGSLRGGQHIYLLNYIHAQVIIKTKTSKHKLVCIYIYTKTQKHMYFLTIKTGMKAGVVKFLMCNMSVCMCL